MVEVTTLAPWVAAGLAVGGVAAAASRRREYVLRWCLWAVGVPVVLALFWWGDPGAALLAGVVGALAAVEYGALTRLGALDTAVLATTIVGVVLAVWLVPDATWRVVAIGLLALAAVPVVLGDQADGGRRLVHAVFAVAWLSPLAAIVPLGSTALAIFLAVSLADVVAHFAGPAIGGPRLSPLSPAKRWSGALAGAAAGLALLAVLGALTWPVAIAVAVGGPAGDLVESMLKRGLGVKDSGRIMAGAGGLLDRIDSLLIALAVAAVLS